MITGESQILQLIQENGQLENLYLNEQTLLTFPPDLFDQPLKSVELEDVVCPISVLKGLCFIPTIEKLILSYVYETEEDWDTELGIGSIPEDLIRLTHLRYLELSGLALEKLPADFQSLKRLKVLDLSENNLAKECLVNIPDSVIDLDLSFNDLKNLDESLLENKGLEILNLQHCKLKKFPLELGKLTSLYSVNLSHNQLKRIPEGFISDSLNHLKLVNCLLNRLDISGQSLPKLNSLDASSNQIQSIADSVCELPDLRDINISRNEISHISPSIHKWKKLETLNLSHNQLDHLPDQIGDLETLKHLNLSYNYLGELNTSVYNLKNLEVLDLTKNHVSQIHSGIESLKKLRNLQIHQCGMIFLSDEISQLENLEQLVMGYNWIKKFPEFENLKKLKFLDISGSKELRNPDEEILKIRNLPNLGAISLTNTPISTLPLSLKELPKLTRINMRGTLISKEELLRLREVFAPIYLWF